MKSRVPLTCEARRLCLLRRRAASFPRAAFAIAVAFVCANVVADALDLACVYAPAVAAVSVSAYAAPTPTPSPAFSMQERRKLMFYACAPAYVGVHAYANAVAIAFANVFKGEI